MKNIFRKITLAAMLFYTHAASSAADIDLYVNAAPNDMDLPNVLFVVDNTANWNTAFTNEMEALKSVFENLPEDKFRIGIMMFTETGGGNSGEGGAYVRAAIRQMSAANKLKYYNLIAGLDKTADKSNGGKAALMMAEAYRYFTAGTPYAGNNKEKTDYTGNTFGTTQSKAIYTLPGNALTSKSATTYTNPILSGCQRNYIIYISNGPAQDNNSDITTANSMLTAAGGNTAQISLSPSGSQSNPSDEWARFMAKSSHNISTFAIDVDPISNGQGPGWTALLKSMSEGHGNGAYTAVNSGSGSAAIVNIINDYLSKIQSVNSVFAAVSLPANANVQGAYLNQLYVGMFRPDIDIKPRWLGNLKQYKLNSAGNLADADGTAAINTQTGFIDECVRSFWTPSKSSPDAYWENAPKGECIPPNGSPANHYKISNTPDGNIVEKGAQGYIQRNKTPGSRNVKTCSSTFADCTELLPFTSANVSTANLGAANTTERDALLNWAKGQNIDAELGKAITVTRPSVHGDVIHSNPLAISYGSNVVVFYGANDGMFRAINGNQSGNIGTATPGSELWAFMPPEFLGNIKRLRDNTVKVKTAVEVDETPTGSPKPYGIDGPVSGYKTADGTKTWIFGTMRRGGRAVYAFDVSDPAAPALKWKKGCPNLYNDTGCTEGFEDIGQTWSSALAFRAPGYHSGSKPMLIMGGGYDDCEDADTHTCVDASKGKKIYVLDADEGTRLTTLPTDRGVIGDISLAPNANGLAKYAYAVDLGGNIYRITIGNADPEDWTITKIASLGCATAANCTNNRKFMVAPSVVAEKDGSYSIFVGSGDREKPLNSNYFPYTTAVNNYFFKVIDKPDNAEWLTAESTVNCPDASVICLNSLLSAGSTATGCDGISAANATKGWALGMRATEQVVTPAATRFGVSTFSTHMPTAGQVASCTGNLGTTHVYNLDTKTAMPANGTTCSDTVSGGGLPPPPSKKDVCMNDDCSEKKSICIGCGTGSSIGVDPDNPPAGSMPGHSGKRKVYWYMK